MSPGIATDWILLLSFHNFIAKAGDFHHEPGIIIFFTIKGSSGFVFNQIFG